MVLVADSDVEAAKNTAAALSSWGLQPVLVHDGVEALLTIQRMLPRAVVLDAALPKMYGFQICEMLKRNESLRYIKVVLVGTIYHKGRYHRPPSELYGADVYLEQPDLPDGLMSFMTQFGFELTETASSTVGAPPSPPTSAPVAPDPVAAPPDRAAPPPAAVGPAVAPSPSAPVVATEPAPVAGDEFAEARATAERLARIIVSDIILYEPDKFQAAVLAGNVVEAMDASLGEGRSLFAQRIDARVREEKDFLIEELLRVARERGMQ
jgi:CheY-like chemotaxis protein